MKHSNKRSPNEYNFDQFELLMASLDDTVKKIRRTDFYHSESRRTMRLSEPRHPSALTNSGRRPCAACLTTHRIRAIRSGLLHPGSLPHRPALGGRLLAILLLPGVSQRAAHIDEARPGVCTLTPSLSFAQPLQVLGADLVLPGHLLDRRLLPDEAVRGPQVLLQGKTDLGLA